MAVCVRASSLLVSCKLKSNSARLASLAWYECSQCHKASKILENILKILKALFFFSAFMRNARARARLLFCCANSEGAQATTNADFSWRCAHQPDRAILPFACDASHFQIPHNITLIYVYRILQSFGLNCSHHHFERVPCSVCGVLSGKATVTSIATDKWFFSCCFFESIARVWVWVWCGIIGRLLKQRRRWPVELHRNRTETTNSNTQIPLLSPKYVHFYHRFAIDTGVWLCDWACVRRMPCVSFLFFCADQLPIYHEKWTRARLLKHNSNSDRHSIFKSDCNSIGLSVRSLCANCLSHHVCLRLAAWLTHFINQINK